MKKVLISIMALAFTTGVAMAQTVDSVLEKYITATGGETLWDDVKTYNLKQSFKSGSATDYDMDVKVSFADAAMSKSKTILKRTFIYGVKGNTGWLKVPLGSSDKSTQYETKDLNQKEQDNMRRELRELVLPFWDYKEKGYVATLVGAETLNNKKVNHVELSGKGVKYNLYFDQDTGLLVRKKLTLSPTEIITEDYTNYATSAYGIKYPSEGTYNSTIDKRTVKLTTNLVFNDSIAAAAFAR